MIPPRRTRIDRGPMPGAGRFRFLTLTNIKAQIRAMDVFLRFMLWPVLRTSQSRKNIEHIRGPARASAPKGLVVVAAHYGNHALIQPFLAHHRGLGVREFVFLDLSADGGLDKSLGDEPDCALWRPRRGPWLAWQASYWLNNLRGRYASGRWCLSLDTSDAFVFHRCETRRISDLTDFLESESRDHVYALIIEMYGAGVEALRPSAAPLSFVDQPAYFDPCGFTVSEPGRNRDVVTRGGLQRRLLYKAQPGRSPPLNRIPLVKWRWYYVYVAGTRLILPASLNTPHVWWHSNPTGCLLRFALLNDAPTLQRAAEVESHPIFDDSGIPAYRGLLQLQNRPLQQAFSKAYSSTRDLVDCGLLNPGQWF